MHPDGSSQPMMMNMGYNPMHQQQLHQQQHQQLAQQGSAMMPPNLASAIPGMGGNPLPPQHMGQSMGGPMIGQTSPPQQQGGGEGGSSVGPSQGGYLGGGGVGSGGSGNQNTSEIVNAAIRALHYSA